MKKIDIMLSLLLATFFLLTISMGEELRPPSEVSLTLDTTQRGAIMSLTIRFDIRVAFTEGKLIYELRDTTNAKIERTIIWEGSYDTCFNKQIVKKINIPVGSKIQIKIDLTYRPRKDGELTDANGICHDYAKLVIHRTKRWITYDDSSFKNLEDVEIMREVEEQHGVKIRGLKPDQMQKLYPEIMKEIYKKSYEYRGGNKDPRAIYQNMPQKSIRVDTGKKQIPRNENQGETVNPVVKEQKP